MNIKKLMSFLYFCFQYSFYLTFNKLLFFRVNGKKITYVDSLSTIFQYKEYFVDFVELPRLEKTDVIIDIGANVGISTLYFRKRYPSNSINAYEPDPIIFKSLTKNLKNKNVICYNRAVSNKSGKAMFETTGADTGKIISKNKLSQTNNSKEVIESKKSKESKSIMEVEVVSLESIAQSQKGTIGLLKIDIEGHENNLLSSLTKVLPNVKYFLLEFHTDEKEPQKLSKLLEILEKLEFRYYIESAYRRKNVFEKSKVSQFDFQINIYARNMQKKLE
jgi:FkbM family methyltransferase